MQANSIIPLPLCNDERTLRHLHRAGLRPVLAGGSSRTAYVSCKVSPCLCRGLTLLGCSPPLRPAHL